MIEKLFFLAMLCLPMTCIEGIPYLGEIRHEVSAYIFLFLIGLSLFPLLAVKGNHSAALRDKVFGLPIIMIVMFSVIALSFAPNFITIKDNYFLGRTGLGKFASASAVILYGFGIAFLTYHLAAKHSWDKLIVSPLAWSVLLCAIFSSFEMMAHWSGAMAGVFKIISTPFYSDFATMEGDTRLRSFAFEPPDFANTAGYIWPWILAAVMATKGAKWILFVTLFLVLNGMIILAEARTSLVVITGLVAVFIMLRVIFLPEHRLGNPEKMLAPVTWLFALFLPLGIAVIAYFFNDIVFAVVSSDNISNLSRLASMTSALRMFAESPLYGVGFGQFGFHAAEYMPSWGYYSWEIQLWLFGPMGFWPAVYSVYARFAADMGIVGVLFWLGLWLWLARAVLVETLQYRIRTGEVPFAAYPLILSCFAVLLAGVPCDSVRSPMIWVTMGLVCRYLASMAVSRREAAEAAA
ncbi:MAG: O-antigen ligase family protein [Bdellovibrionales bacterium]|jgi:hypothetical protein